MPRKRAHKISHRLQQHLTLACAGGRSSPLSPVDRAHFVLAQGFGSPSRASADQSKGFVLVGHGVIEPSVGELSPSDRKLYYKRQSFSSPKVTPLVCRTC